LLKLFFLPELICVGLGLLSWPEVLSVVAVIIPAFLEFGPGGRRLRRGAGDLRM